MLGGGFNFTLLIIIGGAAVGQSGICSTAFGVGVDTGRRRKDRIDRANASVVFSVSSIRRQSTLLCRINGVEIMTTGIDLDRRDVMHIVGLGKDCGFRTAWWSGPRQRKSIGRVVAIMLGYLIQVGDGNFICSLP